LHRHDDGLTMKVSLIENARAIVPGFSF
jgi:hypothetical protein